MRAFFIAILVLFVGGAIAAGAYEAGINSGIAQVPVQLVAPAAPGVPGTVGAAPAVAYYGRPYGWGYGFNPFGFLFPLLGLFLFFGLMRAIIGGGRGWGHRGWYADGDRAVPSRFDEWHTRSHSGGTSTSGPATPRQ